MTGRVGIMPSNPADMRIWMLSKVLGWPGRRVATEVGVSQPTVVRTLERMSKDPPTEKEIQEFVSVATPPQGIPAAVTQDFPNVNVTPQPTWKREREHHGSRTVTTCFVIVILALLALQFLIAYKLVKTTTPIPGQVACVRYSHDGRITNATTPNNGVCPKGQYAVTVVQQ